MKAAVIGMGPHGKRLAAAIDQVEGLALAAVVDLRADVLESLALDPDVVRYDAAEALWQAGAPEVVCVTTNGPSHAALTIAAIEAGTKCVLVEKPMGCSAEECDRMIDAANQHGARLAVDNGRRHDPKYMWLRDRIRSGDWGDLRAIWIQQPGIGIGCLGSHSFDLVHFLSDASTRRVTAWVDAPVGKNPRGEQFVDPGGTVVMDLGANKRAIVAQIEDGAGPMTVEIDCTAARVRIDEKLGGLQIVERDLSVIPGPGRPPRYEVVAPAEVAEQKPNMMSMLRGVLTDLIGDQPMACDAVHGRAAVEVMVGAHLSHDAGNVPVALPLEDRARWLPVT